MIDSVLVLLQVVNQTPFEKIIDKIAHFIGVIDWDWIAFIIAISALIVAYRTLQSQKKTQENTKYIVKPRTAMYSFLLFNLSAIINLDILLFLLKNLNMKKEYEKIKFSIPVILGSKFDIENDGPIYDDDDSYFDYVFIKGHLTSMNTVLDQFVYGLEKDYLDQIAIEKFCMYIRNSIERVSSEWKKLALSSYSKYLYKNSFNKLDEEEQLNVKGIINKMIRKVYFDLYGYSNLEQLRIRVEMDNFKQNYDFVSSRLYDYSIDPSEKENTNNLDYIDKERLQMNMIQWAAVLEEMLKCQKQA